MTTLFIDIETRSRTDLKAAGAYRYAEDPDFRILMAAWAIDDGPVQVALTDSEIWKIPGLWNPLVHKVAHNAAFERICFSRFMRLPVGSYLEPEPWHDTMAIASELAYPAKLGPLAVALGAEPKDEAGTRLINMFCVPNRKGEFTTPEEKPEEWAAFIEYCRQDVSTLRDVHNRLGGWPTETERQIYLSDQRINDTGIKVDVDLAKVAREAALENQVEHELEFTALTGVANPSSGPQVQTWIRAQGLQEVLPDLRAETVEKALQGTLTPPQRRALEIRQELALVAAKKYSAALAAVNGDGRLRGSFRFYGAHTGRWTGRGVQLHNLPRASLPSEAHTDAAILDLMMGAGADAHTLKALVRPLFTGPFTVVDYAAIEARVIAWLAGEQWALKAFRAGRDIYVETAQRMGGLTRAQGKVAVLALGYNGAVGSLEAMGAKGSERELLQLVYQWRKANPAIVRFWSALDEAFRDGEGRVGDYVKVTRDGADRAIELPSGRFIVYHDVKPDRRITFKNYARGGARTDTYGGRLTENVTQAVARDILGEALVRLHQKDFRVVGHVHDEILVEGGNVKTITRIMTESPSWATDLPIDGEGFVAKRYRKG